MATSRVQVTEGSGKNMATHSFTEDAVTKDVQRVVLNTSAGTDIAIEEPIAHDAADSTSKPTKIGGVARAGLSGETLVSAADRTNFNAGLDGAQYVRPHCGLEDIVSGNASNTDGSSTSVIAAAGSGVKQYLTSVTVTNMHASTVAYVELKSGTTVMYTLPVPPGGVTQNFPVPLKPNAANEAWNFDPSAAVTTLYCSMVGFKSKI